jgi:hypothetical protein
MLRTPVKLVGWLGNKLNKTMSTEEELTAVVGDADIRQCTWTDFGFLTQNDLDEWKSIWSEGKTGMEKMKLKTQVQSIWSRCPRGTL